MALDLFHRIVAPTDFSACSEEAWARLRRLAARGGQGSAREEGRKWVEQELDKWAGAARDKGISARTFVRMGSPYQEIVDLATDEHADLVVIGTHGRSVVSRLLSAAWRIA